MRKALHYDPYPDKDWLITAALIYDKILLEDIGRFDAPDPATDWLEKEDAELIPPIAHYYEELVKAEVDFLEEAYNSFDWNNVRISDPIGQYDFCCIDQLIGSEVDKYGWPEHQKLNLPGLLLSVQSLLPVDTNSISIRQIIDFRAENELRRVKFQRTADDLLKSFGEASGEEEAQRILRLVRLCLTEEYEKLEKIYRHTKIEANAKFVGTIGCTPALLGVLGSVLGISCVEAAGFVAGAALSVVPWLIAREKADMTVNDSAWAYLWHLKRDLE